MLTAKSPTLGQDPSVVNVPEGFTPQFTGLLTPMYHILNPYSYVVVLVVDIYFKLCEFN